MSTFSFSYLLLWFILNKYLYHSVYIVLVYKFATYINYEDFDLYFFTELWYDICVKRLSFELLHEYIGSRPPPCAWVVIIQGASSIPGKFWPGLACAIPMCIECRLLSNNKEIPFVMEHFAPLLFKKYILSNMTLLVNWTYNCYQFYNIYIYIFNVNCNLDEIKCWHLFSW